MERIWKKELNDIFHTLGILMEENRDYLIQLDSVIGDGDLGITMSKGFKRLSAECDSVEGEDLGKRLMKLGMILAEVVPSTMGTLMASGLMSAGKAVKGQESLDTKGLAILLEAFAKGIMERGKAKPGEKTVVDSLYPAAEALREAADRGLYMKEAIALAYEAAVNGLRATIDMKSTYGKAAVYQEKSIGKQDPGATVGKLFLEGFYREIMKD